jgi:hypothetical protein
MRKVLFREQECYICEGRIKTEDRIEGYNYYAMRHSDDDWSKPVTIENGVVVNYYGLLATKKELKMDNEWSEGRYEIVLTDAESDFLGCAASADYETNKLDESEEALTIDDFEDEE